MLRKVIYSCRPSSIAGAAIYCALNVANRATVVKDPTLQGFMETTKPLSALATSFGRDIPDSHNIGVCSPIYVSRDIQDDRAKAGLPPRPHFPSLPRVPGQTLINTLRQTCERFSSKNAMGVRPLDHIEKKTRMTDGKEKVWDVPHFKPSVFYTYGQLWERVECFGRGMMELGLKPDAHMALCEETRMEWFVSCYGLWYAGAVGCTLYANMNASAYEYALNLIEASHLLCNGAHVPKFVDFLSRPDNKAPRPVIIYTDKLPDGYAVPEGFTAKSFAEVIELGKASTRVPLDPLTSSETALIMFTSGTTGKPKGAMISHDNILATLDAVGHHVDACFGARSDVTYLAYLPLAHILEFAVENTVLHRGMMVGYGSPRTLTNTAAYPHGDLQEFRPQFLVGVPRVYDAIRKTVYEKLDAKPIAKFVFDRACEDKLHWLRKGYDTPLYNKLLFGAVRENLGGRVEAILSGGAPISPKVQQFLQTCITTSVVQGYGLTETCAVTAIQQPGDRSRGCAGMLLPGVQVKLRDTNNWKHTDLPEPRGEILVRGPTITKGYYKRPEKTAEAYEADGWFKTGDVGAFTHDGNLRIVGRVESLIKNANGEYIAMEALESIYGLNAIVNPNSVCVLVDQHKEYIAAIVCTDMHKSMAFAEKHNIKDQWPAILKNPKFMQAATESFRFTGENGRLKPFELVRKVVVVDDEWTPENGCLTAAMKLKREVILDRYSAIIKAVFDDEKK